MLMAAAVHEFFCCLRLLSGDGEDRSGAVGVVAAVVLNIPGEGYVSVLLVRASSAVGAGLHGGICGGELTSGIFLFSDGDDEGYGAEGFDVEGLSDFFGFEEEWCFLLLFGSGSSVFSPTSADVVHKLEKSGLCFQIPLLGLLLPSGWIWASRSEVPDLHTCNEDLADWRLPGRSSFQRHIDLIFVLLGPFQKLESSLLTWGSASTFGFPFQPKTMQMIERTSMTLQCNFISVQGTPSKGGCNIAKRWLPVHGDAEA
ncbi:hypothetical protein BS78_03G054900 [Paspalum vaginatum]|nr:hypothetical protein BS78_03G054900 [Paspalum vaginatum]